MHIIALNQIKKRWTLNTKASLTFFQHVIIACMLRHRLKMTSESSVEVVRYSRKERFDDNKGGIRSRKSMKDRQYNCEKKKRAKHDIQSTTQ